MSDASSRFVPGQLIEELRAAVPEFIPDEDDVRDGLAYLVFNSLASWIGGRDPVTDEAVLGRVFGFLEGKVRKGDPSTVDVIRDSLWGLASNGDIERYHSFLGKYSQRLLRQSLGR